MKNNRERIRRSRANKSEEEKHEELKQTRAGVKLFRSERSFEGWKTDCEADRERKGRESEQKDILVTEFEKI